MTGNTDDVIWRNCNIHKGVTIGQENRGKREDVPTILITFGLELILQLLVK